MLTYTIRRLILAVPTLVFIALGFFFCWTWPRATRWPTSR